MEIQSDGPSPSRYEIVKARKEAEKEYKDSGGVIAVLLFFAAVFAAFGMEYGILRACGVHGGVSGEICAYTFLGIIGLILLTVIVWGISNNIRTYYSSKKEVERLKELEKNVL